jgi:prepilin-type N-terminal cleavage/methylation domain-containing protein
MTARHAIIAARRGFTLIEVMVSVGIVVLLGALVLAAVIHAKTTSYVIRTRSDLASIGNALAAYKADFGDYPRFPSTSADYAALHSATPVTGGYDWLDNQYDRGARLLCRALIGPAGGTINGLPGEDGADGPGFRVRRNLVTETGGTQQLAGKVYGPYLQADRWKLVYDPNPASATGGPYAMMYNAKMLDVYGNPVLYYPATPGGVSQMRQPNGFVYEVPIPATSSNYPLYNAFDNHFDFTPPLGASGNPALLLDPVQMTYILGDRSMDWTIGSGESAVTTQPYLLWSAGADGKYGFGPIQGSTNSAAPSSQFNTLKIDDICNFDIPADLRN